MLISGQLIALPRIYDDDSAMNISSSVNLTQLNATSAQGADVRQDYSVAVALKAKDIAKQNGSVMEELTESATAPDPDDKRGKNLAAYA